MAIEIVDLPIENGDFPDVCLAEGNFTTIPCFFKETMEMPWPSSFRMDCVALIYIYKGYNMYIYI